MSVARRAETVMAPGAPSASVAGSIAAPGVKSTADARRRAAPLSRFGPLLLIAVLVAFWEAGVKVFDVPNFLLPAPSEIVSLSIRDWPLLQMHTLVTLKVIVTGYCAAAAFALAISALMIRFPLVEQLVMPLFVGLQSVPKIAVAPLILIWVGAGAGSKILVVMSIAFFPIVINTLAGFKQVDEGAIDVFRTVAATERQQLLLLRIPYAVPYIFAGLRIATTLTVMGAIVAEWLAASDGLGYLVLSGSFNFNTARTFSAIIMLSIIGMVFFHLMSWVEARVSWRSAIDDSTGHA
jgi:NitT/TauT family transport system permease protein